MNLKKIRRLMKKYDLYCPIRKANTNRRIAKAIHTSSVADNLVKREFRTHGARKILLTDITYVPYQRDFCYLSVIKDAYTEQALSYVLSKSLEVDFVLQTVNQLMANHGMTLESDVLIHSDQGCHYTCVKFRQLLENYGLRQSMTASADGLSASSSRGISAGMLVLKSAFLSGRSCTDCVSSCMAFTILV